MIIRDALYGDIEIYEEVVIELLSTYEFQRLRKIKQLGLTYFLFPTAEHTRYSHSVGVYHLSTKIVDVFEEKQGIKVDKNERLAFTIACLLHDIGHGAFSHTSEEVFKFHHEDYSIKIIEDENSDINKVLNKYCPDIISSISSFIKKDHENKMLVSAISSTVDIDRMDYLMRDSYFAGVVYGQFDVDRILKLIDVDNEQMVFLEKGVRTLEDFIMSRYHMFVQVYLNEKTIKYERVAIEILNRARELYDVGYLFKTKISVIEPFLKGEVSVSEYIAVQDYYLLELIDRFAKNEEDDMLRDLSKFFILQGHFKEEGDDFKYHLKTNAMNKTLYNESVLIKMENGDIKPLEEISPLVNFLKEGMKISVDEMDVYL